MDTLVDTLSLQPTEVRTDLAIEVRGLRKSFGNHTVLDGIDFAVGGARCSPCSGSTDTPVVSARREARRGRP
jgi:hypothetical protein